MTAPGTELIKGGKGQDLRGKKTERVSDKLTNNVHGTINTEEFKFEDQEIGSTYRKLEEVKDGHINEENESDAENASKNNSIVVQNKEQSLTASNGNNAASRNNRAVAQEEPDM